MATPTSEENDMELSVPGPKLRFSLFAYADEEDDEIDESKSEEGEKNKDFEDFLNSISHL